MDHKGTVNIKTKRLLLRKLSIDDASSLFELGELGQTLQEAQEYMKAMVADYNDPKYYHWGIYLDGRIIGRVKVNELSDRDHFAQLGYGIALSYRNKGYMTEAVSAVAEFLLSETCIHRIYVEIRANNRASRRVAEKVGMKLEGCLRSHFLDNANEYADVYVYGLLLSDIRKKIVRGDERNGYKEGK